MADNQLLAKRSDEDFLSEDDPLAELARLVGFDPAPAAKAAQPAQRREPVFDLEDELLKELEIYQQPAVVPVASSSAASAYAPVPAIEPEIEPVDIAAAEPARDPEPEFEPEAEIEPDADPVHPPVILEAVETFSDPSGEHVYERPASHPVFDLEDEILREFSAFDARRVSHVEEHQVAAEVIHQDPPAPEARTESVPAELHDVPDVRSAFVSADHGRKIYESFRADDLDEAISNAQAPEAMVEAVEPAVAPVLSDAATVESVESQADAFSVESLEPLDENFWSNPETDLGAESAPLVEPVAVDAVAVSDIDDDGDAPGVQASFVESSIDDLVEQEDELVSQDFADAITAAPVVTNPPVPADMPMVAVVRRKVQDAAPSHQAPAEDQGQDQDQHQGQDDLLSEVEKYPVVDNAHRWGVQSKPVAAEDVVRAAPPVVQDFAVQPAAAAPAQPAIETQPAALDRAADTGVDESSFDIDLGDIELDLSDINEGEISASPELLAELANEPVVMRDEPFIVQPATLPPVGSVDTDYSSLPFDPSQITQEDETFEAIAEMDVPEVPVVHEEVKPAPHPEYDIDLDAEMAQLFVTATTQPSTTQRGGQPGDASIALDGATPRSQPAGLDLDDFERALEEDFRRSFAENRSGPSPDRVSLAPVYSEANQPRSGRSWALLASAAAAIVVFGGAGVYAFMSGDTKILASSEPKVIMADTDPVKVVPDDPGGKQVPNQNKAVYDRVGGEKADRTKQESLLTSNEEPVDVVQRTLMPEALPMDDDSMAAATPTGDTIDPRLLPDEEEADRVTTTNKVVSGVSPRKVKTMVVRPDGTLIEREVTEEDLKQQATNDAELMNIARKAAQDAATASDSQSDDIAKAIDNVPERLAANDETAVKPVDVSARIDGAKVDTAVDTTAETSVAKVPPVEPVVIEDEKPAVAEKPVDATDTDTAVTEVKPEATVTEEKPVEVAAETKPVETVDDKPLERSLAVDDAASNADAVTKAANAEVADEEADAPVRKVKTTKITPVPEVRPVEQPVDIVGTVDDQGKVRTDAETKTKTEVAALDNAAQKPAETVVVPAGSYVIQIASLPSEAEAQTSYNRLSAKFGGIIGGKGVDIRRAEIKNKGTYYRVRIPAGSKQEAQALCSQYKAAGGSCLVSK